MKEKNLAYIVLFLAIIISGFFIGRCSKSIQPTSTEIVKDTFVDVQLVPVEKTKFVERFQTRTITKENTEKLDSIHQQFENFKDDCFGLLERSKTIADDFVKQINSLEFENDTLRQLLALNEYKDSIDTKTYNLKYNIISRGFLQDFNYQLTIKRPTIITQTAYRVRNNSLFAMVGTNGLNPQLGLHWRNKWRAFQINYHPTEKGLNQFSAQVGVGLNF